MKKVILIAALAMLSACGQNFSNGSYMGVVTKLSEKGLIFKSWEGEVSMGGMRTQSDGNGSTSIVANVLRFNVDPAAVEKVKAAQKSGKSVELVYRQWLIAPLSISNDHVVVDVR